MRAWRATFEAIGITALGVWLGALITTGAAAASIFPAMKRLTPTLPAYERFPGEHWRIAGGQAVSGVFLFTDAVQLVCGFVAALALIGLVVIAKRRLRGGGMWMRTLALGAALALVGYQFFFFTPGVHSSMTEFWGAAAAGEAELAEQHRAAFDAKHRTATALMAATAACVLAALLAASWTAASWTGASGEPQASARPGREAPRLETPLLARSSP